MRCWLFVPGHERRKVEKALASEADAVVVDWEDAVPNNQKQEARAVTEQVLSSLQWTPRLLIRVNSLRSELCHADLAALEGLPAQAVMLPKVDDPAQVGTVAVLGLPIVPMIESALGLEQVYEIATIHPLVERLAFGSLDFLADVGGQWTEEGEALRYARSRIVVAGRAAGLERPIDGIYPRLRDLDGLRREALIARRLGFGGKMLIHPEQIAIVKQVFSPSAEEIAEAREIVAAFEEALADQRAAISVKGRFVDPPVVRWAQQVLRMAGETQTSEREQ